ncbi:MAG: 3-phosphoshikimate 1-carboxyvinyltransferase [Acidobacteriia bacterium]|nr:3-phosphoshikimate 1-carboxyvinyltransferase [Terriglobia bacterium]
MRVIVKPSRKISGIVEVPGDKSISHRLAMLGAIATGQTIIRRFSTSSDCLSTVSCLRQLGIQIEFSGSDSLTILGQGLRGLKSVNQPLDAGNSGTTMRLLSGILGGQNFSTTLTGDNSLNKRPMNRIIEPLSQMGVLIQPNKNFTAPLKIEGGTLQPIDYLIPVASAQVKSSILLAGLYAQGMTQVQEIMSTRNHTEIALQQFGVKLEFSGKTIKILGGQQPKGLEISVPRDISSAAFFVAATLLLPNSEILIEQVSLNPGRRAILDVLIEMGASIEILQQKELFGELIGDLRVHSSTLKGGSLTGSLIPKIIDEVPILAILATQTHKGITIRDAGELRVKESDRIQTLVQNLRIMGAKIEEYSDGMFIPGQQILKGGTVHSHGDHRISMAFAIAGLIALGPTYIKNGDCTEVSFPGFFSLLEKLCTS